MPNRININIENKDDNENENMKFFRKKISYDSYKIYDKKIEKDLIYLPYADTLKKVLSSIQLLIELFNVKKLDLYGKTKKMYKEINKDNKFLTLREIKEGIDFFKRLRDIDINIISFNADDNISLFIDF